MKILIAMIAVMPFEKSPYLKLADSLFGIPEFTVVKLLGIIGLVWAAWEVMSNPGRLRLDSLTLKAFGLYLTWIVFITIASGAGFIKLVSLTAILLFLPVVLVFVRTEKDLWTVMMAAAVVWVLVFAYGYRQMGRFGGRFGVGLDDPNYVALALVLLAPLPFVLARSAATRSRRLLWIAGFGVLLLSLILTGSRGGALGLAVAVVLLTFGMGRRPVVTLAGIVALVLTLMLVVPNSLGTRLLASLDPEAATSTSATISERDRRALLQAGLNMIRANPVFGVGLGNFKDVVQRYGEVRMPKIAHNTYVHLAAELGVPGLLFFGLIPLATFVSLSRSARLARAVGNRPLQDLAIALRAGLAGYMVAAFFLSAQYEKFFWLVIFSGVCLELIVRRQAFAAREGEKEPPRVRAAVVSGVIALAISTLAAVPVPVNADPITVSGLAARLPTDGSFEAVDDAESVTRSGRRRLHSRDGDTAGAAAPVTQEAREAPRVARFDENPIIRPEMLPGRDGRNINGPSLIRVPEWVEKPLGKYYLYFAHHHGKYIRLAYADRLQGPWTIHEPGTLHVRAIEAMAGPPREPPVKGIIRGVNAPDVHVDHVRREIRMYVGVAIASWGKASAVAISQDGIHFTPRSEPLGGPYFRVFQWAGHYYSLDRFGAVYRSRDGLTGFERVEPGGFANLATGRKVPGSDGPLGRMRHSAVKVDGNRLSVFFSRTGDMPESIMLARIELAPDPKDWKVSEPIRLLEPEMDYEGADLPLVRSTTGPAHQPIRQLRDPAIFQEDGRTYLLYSVAGESGIAIAELRE